VSVDAAQAVGVVPNAARERRSSAAAAMRQPWGEGKPYSSARNSCSPSVSSTRERFTVRSADEWSSCAQSTASTSSACVRRPALMQACFRSSPMVRIRLAWRGVHQSSDQHPANSAECDAHKGLRKGSFGGGIRQGGAESSIERSGHVPERVGARVAVLQLLLNAGALSGCAVAPLSMLY